jgi:hypothetical protein
MSDSPMLHQGPDDSPMLGGEKWQGDVCPYCNKRVLMDGVVYFHFSDLPVICHEDCMPPLETDAPSRWYGAKRGRRNTRRSHA